MDKIKDFQLVYKTSKNIAHYFFGLLMICLNFPILFKTIELFTIGNGYTAVKFLTILFFFLFCGIALIHKKELYVNAVKKSLLLRYTFLGLPFVKDTIIYDIEFVGVHVGKDFKSKDFTIKLWFLNNKCQDIACKFSVKSALDLGIALSQSLKVNLLDNTVKGRSIWIEKF